jgi:DNA-binding winged helix-turn-helix (wHTH) protein
MERRVVRNGRPVELTVKEFALLEYLMLARGRTCSRSELLKEVWQMSPDAGTNVVDVYVNYLRKKLSAGQPPTVGAAGLETVAMQLIETVRGEGYSMGVTTLAMAALRKPVLGAGMGKDDVASHRADGFDRPASGVGGFVRGMLASA